MSRSSGLDTSRKEGTSMASPLPLVAMPFAPTSDGLQPSVALVTTSFLLLLVRHLLLEAMHLLLLAMASGFRV